ncbi:MAG: FN3 associated domain-containing protein, partial [Spirochaetia bacterium]
MKKPLYVLLITILACLAFSSCSLPGQGGGGPEPTPTPTPGTGNELLEFSHAGGVYYAVFDLTISDPEGRQIYYTLNGVDPTLPFVHQLYNAPITISGSHTVMAAALNDDGSYSEIRTKTYQVDDNAG